jgi:hypothetical protein
VLPVSLVRGLLDLPARTVLAEYWAHSARKQNIGAQSQDLLSIFF